jgi:hypothetical protein
MSARPSALFLVLALCGASAAEVITPLPELFAHKAKYDGKYSCVLGKTSFLFKKAASRNGNPYFTIWINDGDSKIKVFGFGVPKAFAEGDAIEACGKYEQVKKISNRVFYDEFTADVIITGAAMRSGLVDIDAAGRFALKGAAARSELVQLTTNKFVRAGAAPAVPAAPSVPSK